jgi:probable HAF family extracellular repeat protein
MTASVFSARLGRVGAFSLLRPSLALAALIATGLFLGTQPAHARFIFRNIINLHDPTFNQELGINNFGTIAGYFGSGAAGHPNKGYTVVPPYTRGHFTNENFPGSVQTQVTGINDQFPKRGGVTVGFWSNTNLGVGMDSNFGFVDFRGHFINVNNPNTPTKAPSFNQLLGVNNNNIAVGFYTDANGANHGYTYTINGGTFSGDINDPNAGTGMGQGTTAAAINNKGQIVGFYTDKNGVTHGFFLKRGVFTTIDPTGSTATQLLGVNDKELAVGDYVDANGVMHGLLYNLTNGNFLTLDDPQAATSTTINGINNKNQLVGFYVNGAGNTIGLIAVRH